MINILTVCFIFIIFMYQYNRGRIVSSISVWTFCYLLIFILHPVLSANIYRHSDEIAIYSLIGITLFFLGIIISKEIRIKRRNRFGNQEYLNIPNFEIMKLAFWGCLALSIGSMLYMIGTEGMFSIIRGLTSSKQLIMKNEDVNERFYIFTVHMLVPCVLGMWIASETKKQKKFALFTLLCYIIETILFGFTRIFLICIIGMIIFYELRNFPKSKQIFYLIVGVIFSVVALVSLNFIRSIGLGRINDLGKYFNADYMLESTDFSASYYYFDRLLDFESPYINPIVYLKPFYAFIPRNIWPSKPEKISMQLLNYTNPGLSSTGYSTAGNSVLGEGYAILGYFGLFIYPFIWGIICEKFDRDYYNRLARGYDHCINNIFYYIFAVFIVISAQRGDWNQYMIVVIWFYFIPLYLFTKIHLNVNKR